MRTGGKFKVLNLVGYLTAVAGGLSVLGGLAGSLFTLVKTTPEILSSPAHLDQPITLFVLTLFGASFAVSAAIGCAGVLMIGSGVWLISASAGQNSNEPIDKASPTA
jgi:hypothetical protein